MLQRGFRRDGGSRRKPSVWLFPRNGEPFWKRIEKIGGEDEFYSSTSDGSFQTLDDQITEWEAQRQADVRAWRKLDSGAYVDPHKASAFIGLTGTRTRALRSAMLDMVETTLPAFGEALQSPELLMGHIEGHADLERMILEASLLEAGVAATDRSTFEADPRFRSLRRMIAYATADVLGHGLAVAFRHVDRAFRELAVGGQSDLIDAHKSNLGKLVNDGGVHNSLLEFDWTVRLRIHDTPWILPDCAIIEIDQGGRASPYLLGKSEERTAIILPLSPSRILMGQVRGASEPALDELSNQLAACSRDFFLASTDDPALFALLPQVGTAALGRVGEATEAALEAIDPLRAVPPTLDVTAMSNIIAQTHGLDWTEIDVQPMADVIGRTLFAVSNNFELRRITRMVFCWNTAAALAEETGTDLVSLPDGDPRTYVWWTCPDREPVEIVLFIQSAAVQVLCDPYNEAYDYVLDILIQCLTQIHIRGVLYPLGENQTELEARYADPDLGTDVANAALKAVTVFLTAFHACAAEDRGDETAAEYCDRVRVALQNFLTLPLNNVGDASERQSASEALFNGASACLYHTSAYLGMCQGSEREPFAGSTGAEALQFELESNGLLSWMERLDFDLQRFRVSFSTPVDKGRIRSIQSHLERLFWGRDLVIHGENGGYIQAFEEGKGHFAQLKANLADLVGPDKLDAIAAQVQDLIKFARE